MHFKVILRILGLLLMIFSFTQIPPAAVSLIYDDGNLAAFVGAFVVTLLTGFLIWLPVMRVRQDLRIRDGFLVTVMFWSVLSLFGSLPIHFSESITLSFTDALFESVSGLTTTGATVIVGLDELPKSLLYYRQQLQWLGGMGIIVLAVAILPMLCARVLFKPDTRVSNGTEAIFKSTPTEFTQSSTTEVKVCPN